MPTRLFQSLRPAVNEVITSKFLQTSQYDCHPQPTPVVVPATGVLPIGGGVTIW